MNVNPMANMDAYNMYRSQYSTALLWKSTCSAARVYVERGRVSLVVARKAAALFCVFSKSQRT
jgi:hypothetical protein